MPRKMRAPATDAPDESPYETDTPSQMVIDSPMGEEVQLVDPAPLVGDALARERMLLEVKSPTRFEVIQGGVFTIRGYRTTLRPGKIVSSANYDLAALRSQGAQLREVV